MPIRVLLVDDQVLTRQGLKAALQLESDIEVLGEADNSRQAVEKAQALHPDVVLMDLMGPGGGGVEATRAIRQRCPGANILILTVYADYDLLRRAASAGAVGYVLKDIAPGNLANGIRAVNAGKTMLNPGLARRLLEDFCELPLPSTPGGAGHPQGITNREREVLAGVARGLSDKEIASSLFLSESTVKSHLRAVFHKLKVRNRAQAAAVIAENGQLSRIK